MADLEEKQVDKMEEKIKNVLDEKGVELNAKDTVQALIEYASNVCEIYSN